MLINYRFTISVINLVCKSGVEVPVGRLETVKPSNCVAVPNPVKALDELTINGQDMDVVTSVLFPLQDGSTVDGGEIEVSANKVVVKAVPETAVDGSIQLVMANGAGVDVLFTLVKPTVTGYDHATVSAGGTLTIVGTHLDLVRTVRFGESDMVEVEGTETSITLSVPMNAQAGKPTLTLANGTSIEGAELVVGEALFCYATSLPDEDNMPKAGGTMSLNVAFTPRATANPT